MNRSDTDADARRVTDINHWIAGIKNLPAIAPRTAEAFTGLFHVVLVKAPVTVPRPDLHTAMHEQAQTRARYHDDEDRGPVGMTLVGSRIALHLAALLLREDYGDPAAMFGQGSIADLVQDVAHSVGSHDHTAHRTERALKLRRVLGEYPETDWDLPIRPLMRHLAQLHVDEAKRAVEGHIIVAALAAHAHAHPASRDIPADLTLVAVARDAALGLTHAARPAPPRPR